MAGVGAEVVEKWPSITNVPPRELHCGIPVDIRQQAQAEALGVGGISETVHCHGWL